MRLSLLPFAAALLAVPATAQWSDDPAVNLRVSSGASDENQPKVAPLADGGCYISWFDGIGTGWDVRVQRLDAGGNEMWAHGGVLVADRGFSSTQDYGLDVDAAGNAILAYRSDASGSTQVVASSVSPAGALNWGASGITLTNTTDFIGNIKVAGTSDGHAVVAWSQNSTAHLQRLDAAGAEQWVGGVQLAPPAGNYSISDLHDAGTDAILSLVHQTGSQFFNPKHLVAQKLDAAGASLWGAAPVAVYDGGSLQIGNFPSFVPDGSGGAVFAWYSNSPLQCYAQRLDASGAELFPHNGALCATTANQLRVSPSVDYDASTGSTFVFWTETDSVQSQRGVSGQKFDAAGNRQWTDDGTVVVPLGGDDPNFVQTVVSGGNVFTFWDQSPAFGQDVVRGARLTSAGVVDVAPFDVASTPSGKGRLTAKPGAAGDALLAWSDGRNDDGDIYAQNVLSDGSLGVDPVTAFCFGDGGCPCGNDDANAGCANSTGSGALLSAQGSSSVGSDDMEMHVTNARNGQPGVLFSGVNALASIPFRDGFLCTNTQSIRLGVRFVSASGNATWGPGIAALGSFSAGTVRHFQVWYRDPQISPCGSGSNLTNALTVTYRQ